ncbi:MAG: DotG/IcmE/VirB10 family protein, partial [Alphaproteobacteria bacterium]|nr:DotG/IcmE/VirB10 family protein [Alphaproteobacteria bacterium]
MNDDLDEEIIGSEEGFDEFVQKNTLGDLWRNSPVVKVGVVGLVVLVFVGSLWFFGKAKEKTPDSMVPAPSQVSAPPGTAEASPIYVQAVEEQNEADFEHALKTGDSTIPVPVETPSDRLQLPEEKEDTEDPLHRWRRLQEERVLRDTSDDQDVEPVTVLDSEQQNEAMKSMAESMMKQMQQVLSRQGERVRMQHKRFIKLVSTDEGGGGANAGGGGADQGEFDGEAVKEEPKIIIPAGEIEYGQMLLEANSDVPGPVLVLLVSGPLKGSKLIGTFSVQDDYLTLRFDRIVVEGRDSAVDAIALNPDTSLPGIATEVDHRYLQRILLPAAAAFVEGFSEALAQT